MAYKRKSFLFPVALSPASAATALEMPIGVIRRAIKTGALEINSLWWWTGSHSCRGAGAMAADARRRIGARRMSGPGWYPAARYSKRQWIGTEDPADVASLRPLLDGPVGRHE